MDRVWGYRDYAGGRVVDSHVARIRRKLHEDGNEPRFIRTVHGVGYAFQEGVVSARPLEKLPTIRGKLGSTIVVAVGITIFISYALIGFALRNSPRDSEAIDALAHGSQGGRRRGERPSHGHDDRAALGHRGAHGLGREPGHPAADLRGRGAALGRGGQERLRLAAAGRWLVGHGADALAHARIPGAGLGDAGVPAELVVAVPAGRRRSRR